MTTDPLVSTKWLADHLHDKKVKVLDASFKLPGVMPLPKEDYERAHIPHAVFFDVDAVSDHSNSLPHMFPSAEQFGRDIGTLGISNADTVVVYNSGGWVAAPRAWWMFLAFGHDKVRVLDGGLKKWIAEGHPVQGGNVMIKPATFKAKVRRQARAQHRADDRQSCQPGRAGARRAREGALRRQRAPSRGRACARDTSRAASICPTAN